MGFGDFFSDLFGGIFGGRGGGGGPSIPGVGGGGGGGSPAPGVPSAPVLPPATGGPAELPGPPIAEPGGGTRGLDNRPVVGDVVRSDEPLIAGDVPGAQFEEPTTSFPFVSSFEGGEFEGGVEPSFINEESDHPTLDSLYGQGATATIAGLGATLGTVIAQETSRSREEQALLEELGAIGQEDPDFPAGFFAEPTPGGFVSAPFEQVSERTDVFPGVSLGLTLQEVQDAAPSNRRRSRRDSARRDPRRRRRPRSGSR